MKKTNLLFAMLIASMVSVGLYAANDDAIIKQARELQVAKKYDEAMKLYEANTKGAASEKLYVDYAALLINLKKFKECEAMLSKALQVCPNSLRIKNAYGMAKYKNGKTSEASSIFSQVLSQDPENKYAKTILDTIRKEKASASSPASYDNSSSDDVGSDVSYSSGTGEFTISNDLSLEEQKELANKLYAEMEELDKWAIPEFIRLHRTVIEKCHLTYSAQESCWRLSNLYLMGVEPAEYDNCLSCLEHLLKQYPDTDFMADAKNRILVVSQRIGDYTRVCALYDELFQKNPDWDDKTYMGRALEYGNALVQAGRIDEAKTMYSKVLEKDSTRGALESRVAAKKLSEL